MTELRAELDRRNALDEYREAYDAAGRQVVTEGVLSGVRVAVVAMPDAPTAVVTAISAAVDAAGGTVVREVKIDRRPSTPPRPTRSPRPWRRRRPTSTPNDSMSQATEVRARAGPVDRRAAGARTGTSRRWPSATR